MVGIYQVGLVVPAPGFALPASETSHLVDTYALLEIHNHLIAGGGLYIGVGVLSLGFLPYLQAEAVVRFLEVIVPRMAALAREGISGQRKLRRLTLQVAILLAVFNAASFAFWIEAASSESAVTWTRRFIGIGVLTLGCLVTIYLVKVLSENGLGKGIGVLSASSVMSSLVYGGLGNLADTPLSVEGTLRFVIPLICIVVFVWAATTLYQAHAKIPIKSVTQGTRRGRLNTDKYNYIPIPLDYARSDGIVLAALAVGFIVFVLTTAFGDSSALADGLQNPASLLYLAVMVLFLSLFSLLFAFVNFSLLDVADDLRKKGWFIHGIRPGRETVQLMDRVVMRMTLAGAVLKSILFAAVWTVCALGIVQSDPVLLFSTLLVSVILGHEVINQISALWVSGGYEGLIKRAQRKTRR
jgi:preprotein translocase subunit SecY